MTPHRVLLLCWNSKYWNASAKQIHAEGTWQEAQREGSSSGGRAHHWLCVSCPDVELILPIGKWLDNLEYMERSFKLPLILRRSFEFTVTAGLSFAVTRSQPLTPGSYLPQHIQWDHDNCRNSLFTSMHCFSLPLYHEICYIWGFWYFDKPLVLKGMHFQTGISKSECLKSSICHIVHHSLLAKHRPKCFPRNIHVVFTTSPRGSTIITFFCLQNAKPIHKVWNEYNQKPTIHRTWIRIKFLELQSSFPVLSNIVSL